VARKPPVLAPNSERSFPLAPFYHPFPGIFSATLTPAGLVRSHLQRCKTPPFGHFFFGALFSLSFLWVFLRLGRCYVLFPCPPPQYFSWGFTFPPPPPMDEDPPITGYPCRFPAFFQVSSWPLALSGPPRGCSWKHSTIGRPFLPIVLNWPSVFSAPTENVPPS